LFKVIIKDIITYQPVKAIHYFSSIILLSQKTMTTIRYMPFSHNLAILKKAFGSASLSKIPTGFVIMSFLTLNKVFNLLTLFGSLNQVQLLGKVFQAMCEALYDFFNMFLIMLSGNKYYPIGANMNALFQKKI